MNEVAARVWQVGALCRAVGDVLEARFNPVTVQGEVSAFSRASSGHCYFSLKDPTGQIRCVMFKRASALLGFEVRDGDLVELRGRLSVYEQRGDLQMVVESLRQAGAGALYETFLRLKANLQAQGLFDAARKRPVNMFPRGVGVVTSLGAAALHDVVSVLTRRVPHIPVIVAPAAVQGPGAAAQLIAALESLYRIADRASGAKVWLDTILLVRGGGSMEDLWSFNDETLARTILRSPVPVIVGVGHETDFTIADLVADLRAPTPTAAAEMVAHARQGLLDLLDTSRQRLQERGLRGLDLQAQRLDRAAARLVRPSARLAAQRQLQLSMTLRLRNGAALGIRSEGQRLQSLDVELPRRIARAMQVHRDHLSRLGARLDLLDPRRVLLRGYAWLTNEVGGTITNPAQTRPGQPVQAMLAQGTLQLSVLPPV